MNKTTLLVSTLVLAMSAFFTTASYAESHEKKAEDADEMECVTVEELAEMSDEDKANMTEPMCTSDEGEGEEKPKAAE